MNKTIDMRRILIFLAFAFGISWLVALVIYLNGGLTWGPSVFLLAGVYMLAPAVGNILTRVITREGWHNLGLRPYFRRGWPYWLTAWVVPGLLVVASAVVYFALFPQYYDSSMSQLRAVMPPVEINLWLVVLAQTLTALLISPIVNGLFTFGEEFGWRAYLLPKLMPLGGRKMVLVSGMIWGVWHWPIIAMGHNYGLVYPGYPWTGLLATLWFMTVLGIFLSWVTLRGGSVWPAVIGHAAINGIAALPALVLQGLPNTLLGPYASGLVGGIGFSIVAIILFFSPRALSGEGSPMAPQEIEVDMTETPVEGAV